MMRIYLFRSWQITRGGLLLAFFALAFLLALQGRAIQRRIIGVKPGVLLENYEVGGLLPEEVAALVRRLSALRERDPRDAMYFPESGELIPEENGLHIDVAGTVRMICSAKANTRATLLTVRVAPAVTSALFVPVFKGSSGRAEATLAINVAWGEEYIFAMLEVLRKKDAKATFFFVGDWVEKFPELVRAVAADGHEVANHGLYHGAPRSLSREELRRLILENQARLSKVIGRQPPLFFAPPSGEYDSRTVGITGELGYQTILWTIDTIDWQRPSPALILQRIAGKIEPGAIILMHPTAPTLAALPNILELLREHKLKPVTMSQLLHPG